MVAVPAETPVTTPPLVVTVATAVLLLVQTPPDVALLRVVDELTHTESVPVMGVSNSTLTVSALVAVALPQEPLATV
jgi:hypothetical protein